LQGHVSFMCSETSIFGATYSCESVLNAKIHYIKILLGFD